MSAGTADKIGVLVSFLKEHLRALGSKGIQASKKFEERIDTVVFKIRLPIPSDRSCNQTPMKDRWIVRPESYLTESDPRFATEDECLAIKAMLLAEVCEFDGLPAIEGEVLAAAEEILGRDLTPASAKCIRTAEPLNVLDLAIGTTLSTCQVGSAELNVEYRTPLTEGGTHEARNIGWIKPLTDMLFLRSTLQRSRVPRSLLNKVQLKAYSTDKQTMPPYFSNRDYRWATWVDSPQFASRSDCRGVELQLLAQIVEFVDAPRLSDENLEQVAEHLGRPINLDGCQCPITGDYLVYSDFVEAATNPRAGRSPYHIGHLNPLTRGGKHHKENVVWMSDAGNRIQGNDTFDEIVALIKRAAEFHINRSH